MDSQSHFDNNINFWSNMTLPQDSKQTLTERKRSLIPELVVFADGMLYTFTDTNSVNAKLSKMPVRR